MIKLNRVNLLNVIEWDLFEVVVGIGPFHEVKSNFNAEDHIYDVLDLDQLIILLNPNICVIVEPSILACLINFVSVLILFLPNLVKFMEHKSA